MRSDTLGFLHIQKIFLAYQRVTVVRGATQRGYAAAGTDARTLLKWGRPSHIPMVYYLTIFTENTVEGEEGGRRDCRGAARF